MLQEHACRGNVDAMHTFSFSLGFCECFGWVFALGQFKFCKLCKGLFVLFGHDFGLSLVPILNKSGCLRSCTLTTNACGVECRVGCSVMLEYPHVLGAFIRLNLFSLFSESFGEILDIMNIFEYECRRLLQIH